MFRFVILILCVTSLLDAHDNQETSLDSLLLIEQLESEILNGKSIEISLAIKEVDFENALLTLMDASVWKVGRSYRNTLKDWDSGDLLRFVLNGSLSNVKFENKSKGNAICSTMKEKPQRSLCDFVSRYSTSAFIEGGDEIILQEGSVFTSSSSKLKEWRVRDMVYLFHDKEGIAIWNLDRDQLIRNTQFLGNEKRGTVDSIVNLEERLNRRVLGQESATEAVSSAIFNYYTGLSDPQAPIGVFLFLGPTGVGKTELAKTLTYELFKNSDYMTRLDMSHFVEAHSVARLIGSPPGYVNHEDGGQLTRALKLKPCSVVLLDEFEKAHPVVHKLFLPIFDEGYLTDSKAQTILCNKSIFIMTSNICAHQIALLFNKGKSEEEVLELIEPLVIEALSPELYNRVVPIVFKPLTLESMDALVDLMLKDIFERMKQVKNINLNLDESVKEYLITNGFHPTLGARPLIGLIRKKVIANLSFAIVTDGIPNGSNVTLSYDEDDERWIVNWSFSKT